LGLTGVETRFYFWNRLFFSEVGGFFPNAGSSFPKLGVFSSNWLFFFEVGGFFLVNHMLFGLGFEHRSKGIMCYNARIWPCLLWILFTSSVSAHDKNVTNDVSGFLFCSCVYVCLYVRVLARAMLLLVLCIARNMYVGCMNAHECRCLIFMHVQTRALLREAFNSRALASTRVQSSHTFPLHSINTPSFTESQVSFTYR